MQETSQTTVSACYTKKSNHNDTISRRSPIFGRAKLEIKMWLFFSIYILLCVLMQIDDKNCVLKHTPTVCRNYSREPRKYFKYAIDLCHE